MSTSVVWTVLCCDVMWSDKLLAHCIRRFIYSIWSSAVDQTIALTTWCKDMRHNGTLQWRSSIYYANLHQHNKAMFVQTAWLPVLAVCTVSPRTSTVLFEVESPSSVEVVATEPCAKRIRTRAKCRYNRPIVQGGRPEPLKTGTSCNYILQVIRMNEWCVW
jgi:hypothetical protein